MFITDAENMGCGNSKTTATESTPSVRPPQQVETPVEDIRGQNLEGSDPAIEPEPVNHTGNTHKSESADEPSSVGIEQTAVEKFSNSEDNHSDKLPRDDKNEVSGIQRISSLDYKKYLVSESS